MKSIKKNLFFCTGAVFTAELSEIRTGFRLKTTDFVRENKRKTQRKADLLIIPAQRKKKKKTYNETHL